MVVKYNPNRVQEKEQPLSLQPAEGQASNFGGIQAQNEMEDAGVIKSFANALGQTSENLEELARIRKRQKIAQKQNKLDKAILDINEQYRIEYNSLANNKKVPPENLPPKAVNTYKAILNNYTKGMTPEEKQAARNGTKQFYYAALQDSFKRQGVAQMEAKKENTVASLKELSENINFAPENLENVDTSMGKVNTLIDALYPNLTNNAKKYKAQEVKDGMFSTVIDIALHNQDYGQAQRLINKYSKRYKISKDLVAKTQQFVTKAYDNKKINDIALSISDAGVPVDKLESTIKSEMKNRHLSQDEFNNVLTKTQSFINRRKIIDNQVETTALNSSLLELYSLSKAGQTGLVAPTTFTTSDGGIHRFSFDSINNMNKFIASTKTETSTKGTTKNPYSQGELIQLSQLYSMPQKDLQLALQNENTWGSLGYNDQKKLTELAYSKEAYSSNSKINSATKSFIKDMEPAEALNFKTTVSEYLDSLGLNKNQKYTPENIKKAVKYASQEVVTVDNGDVQRYVAEGKNYNIVSSQADSDMLAAKGYDIENKKVVMINGKAEGVYIANKDGKQYMFQKTDTPGRLKRTLISRKNASDLDANIFSGAKY